MIKKTLCELFESNKAELRQGLSGMTLPKDVDKIQQTVSSYLEKVFDSEGDFRLNLTQSEDYILEAAISLLNAQQKISSTLIKETSNASIPQKTCLSASAQEEKTSSDRLKADSSYSLLGAAGGAIAGKLLLGGWGAVFGAIAGVAVSVYLSNKQTKIVKPQTKATLEMLPETDENIPIDVNYFTDIIYGVCESVDKLIDTFRAQVGRVVQKYESLSKPTLEGDYLELIENIQALLGAYTMDVNNDNRSKRIDQRIQILSESLENYDLQAVNYDGTNDKFFNFLPSGNVKANTMVLPAILKNEKVIIKGKVFTKE